MEQGIQKVKVSPHIRVDLPIKKLLRARYYDLNFTSFTEPTQELAAGDFKGKLTTAKVGSTQRHQRPAFGIPLPGSGILKAGLW